MSKKATRKPSNNSVVNELSQSKTALKEAKKLNASLKKENDKLVELLEKAKAEAAKMASGIETLQVRLKDEIAATKVAQQTIVRLRTDLASAQDNAAYQQSVARSNQNERERIYRQLVDTNARNRQLLENANPRL